jgi:hypothetical protein
MMGQKYAAYDLSGVIVAYYDSVDSPAPASVTNLTALTDAEWQTCINEQGQWFISGGALTAVPAATDAELLEDAQATQVAVLSAACAAAIVSGFTSSALGAVHTYPSKVTDQQNLNASVTASLLPDIGTDWVTQFWCADATGAWAWTTHTAAQIQQVGKDGMSAVLALQDKNAQLAAEVIAATTVAAVQAVVWA